MTIAPAAALDDALAVTVLTDAAGARCSCGRPRRASAPPRFLAASPDIVQCADVVGARARRRPRRSRGRSTATTSGDVDHLDVALRARLPHRSSRPEHLAAARSGTSVMTASTPASREAARSRSGSFTVHTLTCEPAVVRRARRRRRRGPRASTTSGWSGARGRASTAIASASSGSAPTTGTRSAASGRAARTRSTVGEVERRHEHRRRPPGREELERAPRPAGRDGPGGREVLDLDVDQAPRAHVEHLAERRHLGEGGARPRPGSGRRAARRACRRRGGPRGAPSAVRWTSSSTPSAPSSTARANGRHGVLGRLAVGAAVREHEHRAHHATHASGTAEKFLVSPLRRSPTASIVSCSAAPRGSPGDAHEHVRTESDGPEDSGGTDLGTHARLGCQRVAYALGLPRLRPRRLLPDREQRSRASSRSRPPGGSAPPAR